MRKRVICLLLALVMVLAMVPAAVAAEPAEGLSNFKKVNTYMDGMFRDVKAGQWYEANIKASYEMGLVLGKGDGTFGVSDPVTLATAITLAARIHSIYHTGSANFKQGNPWYQVYVDYAVANGIIEAGEYSNYNANATRDQFSQIMAASVPESALKAINDIAAGEVHDLPGNTEYAEAAYLLYNAGVITGTDSYGTFKANAEIKRSEAVTIVTRIVDTTLRKEFEPKAVVSDAPAKITIRDKWASWSWSQTELAYGQSTRLVVELEPSGAYSGIVWTSSDPAVATVSENGTVTALGKGTATITAKTYNGKTDTFKITVPDGPAELQYALTTDGKGYEIVGCDPSVYAAYIPAEHNGLPVVSIKGGAFKDCQSLRFFIVDENQTTFYEEGGVVFTNQPEKTLVVFPPCYDIADNYHAPNDTVAVAAYAFAGIGGPLNRSVMSIMLKTLTLPEGVKKLGDCAFYEARRQIKIYVPQSLTWIGKDLMLNQQANMPLYAYPDSAALAYARANEIPCAIIQPFEGEETTVEMVEPISQPLAGASLPDTVVEVPEQAHGHESNYDEGRVAYRYELSSYEETTDGEVRLMLETQWSEIVSDPDGKTEQKFAAQTGLYGAGHTEGSATLRAYDRLGNLVGLMQVSGNFAFSFPGAANLGVEGGTNTMLTVLPVKPIYISTSGYYRIDPEEWYRRADGNIIQYFIVMLENASQTMQWSMDLNLFSTHFEDAATGDGLIATGEPVTHYAIGSFWTYDASRTEQMDAVSIFFDGLECVWEDENLLCLINAEYDQTEEFGRKASELLGKVKETMIGTYFPEWVEIEQIRIDSEAPWTNVAGEGNISLTKDVVIEFNQSVIAHEMVHAVDQQIPNISDGTYAPSPWMEGRAEYIALMVNDGYAGDRRFDWSYLSEEDRADFFHYYYYSTNRFTEYDVGYEFFYYLCKTYGEDVSIEIMEGIAALPEVPDHFEDTEETIEARAQVFKQCVEAATEVGVFQNFVRDVIEK